MEAAGRRGRATIYRYGYWHVVLSPGTDQALLARASNERRLTELYLPGSAPRPMDSPTLGQQEADDVLPLLQLKERARKHLDKDPNDAYWQQVEGRIALAEGNGAKARRCWNWLGR